MLRFFIDRPIFAAVISIIITLAGAAAYTGLGVEQYPDVVPPQVVVAASYPGASAEVLADSVAAPLEQEINGVDDMIYMESTSTDAGTLQIVVSFAMGTDPDQAAINVNNRVQAALSRLPQVVRDLGVRVTSRSTNVLLIGVLTSSDGSMSMLDISNYALLNVVDELVRLEGVGEASLFGAQDYSMRIWLDPERMALHQLTPPDIAAVIREQNAQYAAGRIGAEPTPNGQAFTFSITTEGQLNTPESFADIALRTSADGATLRLRDVARVELGAQSYDYSSMYNGQPTVPIRIFLQPGANALETANRVITAMERMGEHFPAGLRFDVAYDTTEFVAISFREVIITLIVAVVLVVLMTFLFLQHLRATLIPVIAIPISLIGTFAGMQLFGFSVNMLTLFGLVLALGIVVDNAIIVMENVERLMREQGISARDAAIATVQQVSGAVVASTLVLVAVFAPVAFLGGLSGELYRQFAVTIAVSVVISGVVALTLSPALCALLLDHQPQQVSGPFRLFNRGLERLTQSFVHWVALLLRHRIVGSLLLLVCCALTVLALLRLPTGLVPGEDQGVALAFIQLPPVASLSRSEAVRNQFDAQLQAMDEVKGVTTIAGIDSIANSLRTNAVAAFVSLADWRERSEPGQSAMEIAGRLIGLGQSMPEARILAFTPPPIAGLSLSGGIEGYLQVRESADARRVEQLARQLVSQAQQRPEIGSIHTTIDTRIPRYHATVDREKAKAMGVDINAIFASLQGTFGQLYVNDFSYLGRLWQVNLQAEGDYRNEVDDLRRIFVRGQGDAMVPLSTLVTLERQAGADIINRFNIYPAARLLAEPAQGYTSGQAKAAIEALIMRMGEDANVQIGWTGEAYQLDVAAGAGGLAFGMGMLMVFLILAAQYERLDLPLAVASAVPFGVLGGAVAAGLRGFPNDIYFQVGLLVLIGLAAKNAILIVEFAAQNRRQGMDAQQAATTAIRQRLRAILMTAATFLVGTLPLVVATGAGAASRQEIGTVVVGGMIVASSLALLFVPLAYTLLEDASDWIRARRKPRSDQPDGGFSSG